MPPLPSAPLPSAPLPSAPLPVPPRGLPRLPDRSGPRRPIVSLETLALLASVYFAFVSNRLFWSTALADRDWSLAVTWTFAAALLVALVCLHLALLALVLNRWTARLVLGALAVATAVATFYMQTYGVYLDPGMARNAMHSEVKKAGDLIGPALLAHLAVQAGPALLLLGWIRIRRRPLRIAALRRFATLAVSLGLLTGALVFGYQDLSDLFRNHKEARYLITPANYLYSVSRALLADRKAAAAPRLAVGADARLAPAWAERQRPVLFVIVVGETARAASWGLNGYDRDTTPMLGRIGRAGPDDLINFSRVTSCGTDTETSVPCLFSAIGRRRYDEARIRGSESLLHVLARAGFRVTWRDNQTGCKGACTGLPFEQVDVGRTDCEPGRCFDERLLEGLDRIVDASPAQAPPGQVVVLHQLGNHGPAYFNRYPDAFRTFTPTCDTAELRRCPVEAIRNSYDNALRYTDHFLAQTIAYLKSRESTHDTAMIYLSDHGESLGENGLFLHGIPYAIAPSVQTRVPMLIWTSARFRAAYGVDAGCLRAKSDRPLSHDHLFHTVLGLLDVDTGVREPSLDLSDDCRIHPDSMKFRQAVGYRPTVSR